MSVHLMVEGALMRCVAVLVLAFLATASATFADPPPDSPTYRARLDGLLAAQDWSGMGAAISGPSDNFELITGLHWLEAKVDAGQGGMFLPMLFAANLWGMGNPPFSAGQTDEAVAKLRLEAGMMTLYTYELTMIDGTMCEDGTAAGHRTDQVLRGHAATLAYLRARPPEAKKTAIQLALALEQRTAALRGPDAELCSGGMEQMMAGMRAGTVHKLPPQPGQYGQAIGVGAPPGWKPKFLSPDIYKPAQEKMRAAMPDMLARLVQ
jgi:hypothetical protein